MNHWDTAICKGQFLGGPGKQGQAARNEANGLHAMGIHGGRASPGSAGSLTKKGNNTNCHMTL